MNNDLITLEMMAAIPAHEVSKIEEISQPLVSVIMLAYNHGEYIQQAVHSIINQRTEGFSVELLIGEDGSPDNTLDICKELQEKYPHIIRLVISDSNVGMHRNFSRLWLRARGKYIAFCEGDDYWIDERKLAKQVHFLDNHPECTLCGTFTQSIKLNSVENWENSEIIEPSKIQKFYSFEEMIPRYNFHFSSVMLCKNAVQFPLWFWDVYCVDRPLYLLATQTGLAGLIPEITSVYRYHTRGSWSPLSLQEKADKSTHLFQIMAQHFEERYRVIFNQVLGNILFFYTSNAISYKEQKIAKKIFWISIKFLKINSLSQLMQIVKVFVHINLIFFLKYK